MVNGFDPEAAAHLPSRDRAMIERRMRLLGPAYRLFYEQPVQVSRGEGVHLYDADGNEYLDAYNNVVSVGHANPRVAAAVARQMRTLCTHTRYLQDGILDYAEDLLATFDGRIGKSGHAMFTCTGSEANDLAVRIARHYTGKRGIVVTAEAYHGTTALTAGFSPALGASSPLGTWVRQVPAPDSYRLPPAEVGRRMAAAVQAAVDDLERHGEGLAAFIADSLFSSDGIFAHPTDVLAPVAEVVRRAGGLYIADEVQAGFARSGERFWGFRRHGVDPDIVTMGKPMGNGYPVAGLAVVPEAVERFGREVRYFNTFGGNSAAMAAARETLAVIREERLMDNAAQVGDFIRDILRGLMKDHPGIGEVRGVGLYVGVEMVGDRETKEPDAAAATAVVNALRRRRVLISATGPCGNVLKIRPPLVFGRADAERLLTEMEAVFAEMQA
jgi:4-aminobutyrate aminotransferase-like enzyme